mmetsp:Transcript_137568/g.439586  ORF Transcript_137568/g.439586 Transcript_137568/m.439586 type:complete len:213 (-) Transcript_137568:145-783(-)
MLITVMSPSSKVSENWLGPMRCFMTKPTYFRARRRCSMAPRSSRQSSRSRISTSHSETRAIFSSVFAFMESAAFSSGVILTVSMPKSVTSFFFHALFDVGAAAGVAAKGTTSAPASAPPLALRAAARARGPAEGPFSLDALPTGAALGAVNDLDPGRPSRAAAAASATAVKGQGPDRQRHEVGLFQAAGVTDALALQQLLDLGGAQALQLRK